MKECDDCEGTGLTVCPYCGSEDTYECDECGGTGEVEDDEA